MKAYTDFEQSKKLAKILPINSADMKYPYFGDGQYGTTALFGEPLEFSGGKDIPAWSLAALLEILPEEITDDNGYKVYIDIRKYDSKYQIAYYTDLNWSDTITTDEYENLVDAAVEMIFTLKERNLL